jgi:hypothetical protein
MSIRPAMSASPDIHVLGMMPHALLRVRLSSIHLALYGSMALLDTPTWFLLVSVWGEAGRRNGRAPRCGSRTRYFFTLHETLDTVSTRANRGASSRVDLRPLQAILLRSHTHSARGSMPFPQMMVWPLKPSLYRPVVLSHVSLFVGPVLEFLLSAISGDESALCVPPWDSGLSPNPLSAWAASSVG